MQYLTGMKYNTLENSQSKPGNYAKQFVLNNYPDVDNNTAIALYDAFIEGYKVHDEIKETNYEKIIDIVCRYYGTTFKTIKVISRDRNIAQTRQVCMYFGMLLKVGTQKEIASKFNRNHATAIHAKKVISNLIETNKDIALDIIILNERIKNNLK